MVITGVLSATTFWSFVREFSPLEMYTGEIKLAPLRRFRGPGDDFAAIRHDILKFVREFSPVDACAGGSAELREAAQQIVGRLDNETWVRGKLHDA